jgi:hypothetical protein
MLNLRFKNPYKIDSYEEGSEDEDNNNQAKTGSYKFGDLTIYEFDRNKELAPKGIHILTLVKNWIKELETYDMEKYFTDFLIPNIDGNIARLFLSTFFYESNILNLLKCREKITKRGPNRELQDLMQENQEQESSESSSSEEDSNTIEKEESNNIENNIIKTNANNNIAKIEKPPKQEQIAQHKETTFLRRKRKATPRDLRIKSWKEVCYICNDYGDLICCDGCTNVAHLFCACLQVYNI